MKCAQSPRGAECVCVSTTSSLLDGVVDARIPTPVRSGENEQAEEEEEDILRARHTANIVSPIITASKQPRTTLRVILHCVCVLEVSNFANLHCLVCVSHCASIIEIVTGYCW